MKINKDHAPGQSLEGLIKDILDEYYVNNRPRQYADNTNSLENLGNNVALIAALNRLSNQLSSNKFSHHSTAYRPSKRKDYPSYDAEGKENVHSYLDRIFMIKGLNGDNYQRIRKPNNKRLFTIARGFKKEMIKRFESYGPIGNLYNDNSLKMDRNKESVADYIDQIETLYSNFQFNPKLRIEEAISRGIPDKYQAIMLENYCNLRTTSFEQFKEDAL
ncbi:hypothetical protein CONCODRAFT_14259 [Conidiobolus coronatus NRRL 28638]|uniref:Uncharacterized protein n=1 Tax=Conidiobolus coronatus (strain ATCC 28846 / CBS 209.66 / NRRL 28638) TaxID=796925 RepID=A0A137NPC1_CONC2|nr:hypothetical protein CONCODRAFT_14259 [Conidiobolus coronatus NRRL 28638]|eukprot:KXN64586.1 hypothetical protein CONCODRAFT_14259 [Conidiobolus coronatus NRRL 28638]